MSDGVFLLVLAVPMALAFAFGIWAGLGYPGRFDKYDRTGKAPRVSPFRQLMGTRRDRAPQEEEEEPDAAPHRSGRLSETWRRKARRHR